MRISKTEHGLSLSGGLSLDEVDGARARLEQEIALQANAALVLDLAELEGRNSVMLSLLFCCLRAAEKASCELRFDQVPQSLFDMARVGGVESLLPMS